MDISTEMVKELRERTGAGILDCKKTLTETQGNIERAIEVLREKGLARVAKKAGREAKEGVIEAGYDGSNEPGFQRRSPDVTKTKSAEERWLLRDAAAERFLTEGRDPLTGSTVPQAAGGLKLMQSVFGEAAVAEPSIIAMIDKAKSGPTKLGLKVLIFISHFLG